MRWRDQSVASSALHCRLLQVRCAVYTHAKHESVCSQQLQPLECGGNRVQQSSATASHSRPAGLQTLSSLGTAAGYLELYAGCWVFEAVKTLCKLCVKRLSQVVLIQARVSLCRQAQLVVLSSYEALIVFATSSTTPIHNKMGLTNTAPSPLLPLPPVPPSSPGAGAAKSHARMQYSRAFAILPSS